MQNASLFKFEACVQNIHCAYTAYITDFSFFMTAYMLEAVRTSALFYKTTQPKNY